MISAHFRVGNVLASFSKELGDLDEDRIVEPLHYVQEEDKGGFEISGGEYGMFVDMNGFAVYHVDEVGELSEGHDRKDALQVILMHVLQSPQLDRSSKLFQEALRLDDLLGPFEDPFNY